MVSRLVIVGALLAAILLFWGPFSVPDWDALAFILVVFAMGIAISAKRMRAEGRVARTVWQALTRR